MGEGILKDGIAAGRLAENQYVSNFADLHPPFVTHEAFVEADRCYFCYDAPCQTACPTSIDIPLFIREILTDNPLGAAETIFSQNILGGMCARVCPTEQLCEEACVREAAEGKPVKIGMLQRYATDVAMQDNVQFFTVPFTSMTQQGWAKHSARMDLANLTLVRFTWDGGWIDVYIDDVRFYRHTNRQ